MTARLIPILVCLISLLASLADAIAAGASCDRACLRGMLDQYLNAVIKHDPSAAPLFVAFRQTENATVVRAGTGLWTALSGLGKVQRRYLDPVSGQAGFFGIIEENGNPAVATLRLKIDDRKITEAEWIIGRKGDWGPNAPGGNLFNVDALAENPPPERVVPREARASREAMVAIANSYFDGLSTHDGSIIQHHDGCSRIENGTTVTGRGRGAARGATPDGRGAPPGAPALGSGDCAANLEQINIALVAARRYPIVDEEAGVVLGMAIFIRKPGTTTRRNVLTEWFFIDQNRIRSIYAAMFYPPPEAPAPNWPPYDGNWPLAVAPASPPQTQPRP